MDIETLTNHISGLGKDYFEKACKIVLQNVFNLKIINVDGKNDGGTDFIAIQNTAERFDAAYQITTQKTQIQNKAYKDAKKTIEKLEINKFYFLSTLNLSEVDSRKIEHQISEELHINSICFGARHIAGMLLSENLLNQFLDDTNYPLPRSYSSQLEFREMAIHSYTLLSDDASKLKLGIYDDTVLFVLSNSKPLSEENLINETKQFLSLPEDKNDILKRRIGALFGKNLIAKDSEGNIKLSEQAEKDLNSRKTLYEIELASLSSAQVDILRNEFGIDWTQVDSKKVAIWIANAFVSDQISNLKEVKANIVSNPLFDLEANGLDRLKKFLVKEKSVDREKADNIMEMLLENASDHPLVAKISRASVYLALEGSNPISSAKALGANRWSEFNVMLEPTIAIPYICSQLYSGNINRYFNSAIKSVQRAQKLGARTFIPYFYINECAGHLLKARRYNELDIDEKELVYSSNAFVANYYALKQQNKKLPETFMDYLSSYSSSIKNERVNIKNWIRAIMTDLQSLLARGNVEFIDVPFYDSGDCAAFEKEYMYQLNELEIEKKSHLIKHDTFALQFTNQKIVSENEHWIVLTYDRSMISVSKENIYNGWITNPLKFIDFTEMSKPLSEAKLISLVHSVATFSEKTLSAGARIIDRIVTFASDQMQNWEFKQEIEKFKKEVVSTIDLEQSNYVVEIDKKTDEFLKKHGIEKNDDLEDNTD
ncbi:hypothetical protein [Winogradskyella forsetii]|uniref:hypothetical protein n=1 Tax=Winogradskyella forsetii TaxID=2686077 RepID=UPI0015C11223|nr:hypothetical protein [Winogradskyella forsetii]